MELEQMKAIWSDMSARLDRQQEVTDQLILEMAQKKSGSRLGRIIAMEAIGIVVSLVMLAYLLLHFRELDNWLTFTGGLITVFIFLLGVAMSGIIIQKSKGIDLTKNTYQQTLEKFKSLKRTLGFYKKLSIVINVILPFFLLPVVFKLFLDQDLLEDFTAYGWALLTCALITPPVLFLIIRYYRKNIKQVSKAIQEIKRK